jgi:uncharacterized protein (DUF433 family)
MTTSPNNEWKYLAPNPKSVYKQLFIKGTRIRAEVVYGMTVDGSEPMTPQEVAVDFDLPLEVVQEAIAYCEANPQEIEKDHKREETRMEVTGMNSPEYTGYPKQLSAEEIGRLENP